jgi:hypothetical protein
VVAGAGVGDQVIPGLTSAEPACFMVKLTAHRNRPR